MRWLEVNVPTWALETAAWPHEALGSRMVNKTLEISVAALPSTIKDSLKTLFSQGWPTTSHKQEKGDSLQENSLVRIGDFEKGMHLQQKSPIWVQEAVGCSLSVLMRGWEKGLPLSKPQFSPLQNKKMRLDESARASPILHPMIHQCFDI